MAETRGARLRAGAVSWGLFEDLERPGRFVEYFVCDTWADYLRRFDRFTAADERCTSGATRFTSPKARLAFHATWLGTLCPLARDYGREHGVHRDPRRTRRNAMCVLRAMACKPRNPSNHLLFPCAPWISVLSVFPALVKAQRQVTARMVWSGGESTTRRVPIKPAIATPKPPTKMPINGSCQWNS